MDNVKLQDIEAIRIVRAGGNLRVRGVSSGDTLLQSDAEPEVRRVENRAEILLPANATIEVAPGVAFEILECAGNLDIEDITAPISLGRVRGNLRARRIGALAIRGEVAGNLTLQNVQAIEAEQVNGNLHVEGARSIKFRTVAGNVDLENIEGEVSFSEVRGHLRGSGAGSVSIDHAAGKLDLQSIKSLRAEKVDGKLKVIEVSENVIIGKVGGRLTCDDIGGNLSAEEVGGHVALREIRGSVALPKIGGAADLMGPLPGSGIWKIVSRGRISVEVAAETSAKLSVGVRNGKVRLYGLPEDRFHRIERGRMEGTLGAGGLDISLEATDADIILFADDARSRDYDGRRRSSEFRFRKPFESVAEELPEFVGEILGAAGRIVAESGRFTGSIAQEVTRSVGDALRDVERTIADLDEKVPHDVSDKLSRLGRKISDTVERAVNEARMRSRGRSKDREYGADAANSPNASSGPASTPGAEGTRDAAMMKILNAVRDGTLKPEEADRLIAAWAELHPRSEASHS